LLADATPPPKVPPPAPPPDPPSSPKKKESIKQKYLEPEMVSSNMGKSFPKGKGCCKVKWPKKMLDNG